MGNSISVSVVVACAAILLGGLIGVFLEQIAQKLDALESTVTGNRKTTKGGSKVKMIGWSGGQIEMFRRSWGPRIGLKDIPTEDMERDENKPHEREVK